MVQFLIRNGLGEPWVNRVVDLPLLVLLAIARYSRTYIMHINNNRF